MHSTTNDVADAIRDSMHDVLSDAQKLIDTMGKESAEHYKTTVSRLQSNIVTAREHLGNYQRSLGRRTRRAARMASDAAPEHPRATAGRAAAFGAAIGAIIVTAFTRR